MSWSRRPNGHHATGRDIIGRAWLNKHSHPSEALERLSEGIAEDLLYSRPWLLITCRGLAHARAQVHSVTQAP